MYVTPRSPRVQLSATLLCVALVGTACARNPVTGQLQLALIPESQEIEMGRQASQEVAASIGIVNDPPLQEYLQQLGTQMAATSERPNLPWTFRVVDDPTPNAFALPGGFIYFTRGLMSLMNNEAQLASVLGHEIGHVTARHHVTQISRAQLAQVGLGVGGVLFPELQQLAGLAGAGMGLLFLRYGRSAERQADELGFDYSLDQGFDVREMASVFATLERVGEGERRSPLPSWLLTHPEPAERIRAVEQRLATLEQPAAPLRVGRAEYLQRIDGMVHGVNPRNGFFRDDRFLHPDLRFQLALPAAWQRQNLAQAVMAVSPQQSGAIQLTLSDEASPAAAAQRFLQQQGVRAGPAASQTINGLPAVVASFQAQTQQGLLEGLAAFVQHEGRIFQILGYAPVQAFPQHRAVFQQSIASFARLTDPTVLALQPSRIRIVRLPESMSLAEFNTRYPSTIPLAELALLNQVAGPESVLPAGTSVKRVVTDTPGG